MAEIRFPSLEVPEKRAFVYDTMADFQPNPQVDCHMLSYETYGDGMCQHSGAWPIGIPVFADYCWSLADYLLANSDVISTVGYQFTPHLSESKIAFAASVRHKPPQTEKGSRYCKPVYYSISEEKISSADKLRYDKRYEEVPSWADGSPEAICRLLWQSYYDPLDTYRVACEVYEWVARQKGMWMDLPTLEKDAKHDQVRDWHSAWLAISQACQILSRLESVQNSVRYHKDSLERRKAQTEAA